MLFTADLLMGLAGLVVPPVFHFFKGLFMPDRSDDPESTMSTLATTKPEVLGPYVEALAKHTEAQVRYFNRDVVGVPRQWIVDLRAALRPVSCAAGLAALIAEAWVPGFKLDPGTRGFFILATSSWFGSKVFNGSAGG